MTVARAHSTTRTTICLGVDPLNCRQSPVIPKNRTHPRYKSIAIATSNMIADGAPIRRMSSPRIQPLTPKAPKPWKMARNNQKYGLNQASKGIGLKPSQHGSKLGGVEYSTGTVECVFSFDIVT